MEILLVPSTARLAETVDALRDAAEVYGWSVSEDEPVDGTARVRVVPGTCTRQPEALRVLERARSCHADLVAGVEAERMPRRDLSGSR